MDNDDDCLLEIKCYGKGKWTVTQRKHCIETWHFKTGMEALAHAVKMCDWHSEWKAKDT